MILLSLFWKRLTFSGAVAGIVVGAGVDILWLAFLGGFGLYEIIPAFICGTLAAVIVSLLSKEPDPEVTAMFERVAAGQEK